MTTKQPSATTLMESHRLGETGTVICNLASFNCLYGAATIAIDPTDEVDTICESS